MIDLENVENVADLVVAAKDEFEKFFENAELTDNKAAQRRARKHSINLEKIFKVFRKVSPK